ncbi:MAG: hypothetical protein PGN26_05985 [Xylophilus ampelinus]
MSLDLHRLLIALRHGPRTFTAQQLAADPVLLRSIRRALACGLVARPASLHPAAYESGQSECSLARGISVPGLTPKGLQYLETVPAPPKADGADAAGRLPRRAAADAPDEARAATPH